LPGRAVRPTFREWWRPRRFCPSSACRSKTSTLNGLDSLLSIVQMPGGVPVATVAIGEAGAVNAGLLAAEILGIKDPSIRQRLSDRREAIRRRVLETAELDGE